MARPKNPLNTLHKVCPTCQKPFTCERRTEKVYCTKVCAANSPEVKQKNREGVEDTFQKKYGGFPITVDPSVKEKMKATVMEKYGVDWISKTPDFGDKMRKTKLEKYGDPNFNNIERMKITCMENYGEEFFINTPEWKKKREEVCLRRYGASHSSNSEGFRESHKRQMFKKFLASPRFANFEPNFSFDEYDGACLSDRRGVPVKYDFKCKRCGTTNICDISGGRPPRCIKCDKSTTTFQSSIAEYIRELLPTAIAIVINDRTSIHPQEIDIFIPSLKIGIEIDGLYYHSEVSGNKNRTYHLNKTKTCMSKGIRLIHIFEDEWNNKASIVKSILKNALVKKNEVIYARECECKKVSPHHKAEFLIANHVQGNDHSSVKLGLYHKNILVSVMTFSHSRFDPKIQWEMSRFCSKLGYNVVGGSSKLFSHFVKEYHPQSVVSYSDRRYFSGETYLKLGFSFVKNTDASYHYIIDSYDNRENRINWQKAKLEKKLLLFSAKLSEWENMKANGFDRIWDCGHSKWIWVDKTT